MKQVFLLVVLFVFNISSFSQNNAPGTIHSRIKENSRWDLDQFVWSHTHYKTGRNDKPVIDFNAIDHWPGLGSYSAVSPNGKYLAYTIDSGVGLSLRPNAHTLIIQSTENSWKRAFTQATPGFFSTDSKQYIFVDKKALIFLPVGNEQPETVNGVLSYKVSGDGKNEWIAYQQVIDNNSMLVLQQLNGNKTKSFKGEYYYSFDNDNSNLIFWSNITKTFNLYNFKTQEQQSFTSISSYLISKDGKNIVTKNNNEELFYFDLLTKNKIVIWKPSQKNQKIKVISEGNKGNQIVFSVENESKQVSIWYWSRGMIEAAEKINYQTPGVNNQSIQPSVTFTENDSNIRFYLKPKTLIPIPMEDAVQLEIWDYHDTVLQSMQSIQQKDAKPFTAIMCIENEHVTILENDFEILQELRGNFAIVKKKGNRIYGDRFWEVQYNLDSSCVISLKDGIRKQLPTMNASSFGWFSPNEKYWIYFDSQKSGHYFSYNLQTEEIRDISETLPSSILGVRSPYILTAKMPEYTRGPAAWTQGGEGVLVYDDYDIWKLDLAGKKPAINLTNGYGRSNKIVFSLLDQEGGLINEPIKETKLLLTAFNLNNKYNGFYQVFLNKNQNPDLLFMGPCFIQSPGQVSGLFHQDNSTRTLKAANSDVWILKQQTATHAPNYYSTKNFKEFKQLTNLCPEANYNWLTAELVSFQQLDGSTTQAILYKPENFDSTRKYPVIVSFYTQLSDRLYQYLEPSYINRPNIFDSPAWLVSHGYLVLLPDIHFTQSKWGPSTVNTIDGAAKFLKLLPFVDSTHLGATGHSNAGRFGYYLLTHSTSFAAMSVGAGTSNLISNAFSLSGDEKESNLEWAEESSVGTGAGSLWENKSLWLDQTSILNADKVISPLLLFHNKKDRAFSPGQALEMFVALRRLNKPVWWLQYDEGKHTVGLLRDQRDFTIRYTQYFDHFLKNSPAPKWMTQGLPLKLKGVEPRYELDQINK